MTHTPDVSLKSAEGVIGVNFGVVKHDSEVDADLVLRQAKTAAFKAFGDAANQIVALSDESDASVGYEQRIVTVFSGVEISIDVEATFSCDLSFIARAMVMAMMNVQGAMHQAVVPFNTQRFHDHMKGVAGMTPDNVNTEGGNLAGAQPQIGLYL
jgi:hypothetical protein